MAEGGDDLFSRLCYTLNYVLFPCVLVLQRLPFDSFL